MHYPNYHHGLVQLLDDDTRAQLSHTCHLGPCAWRSVQPGATPILMSLPCPITPCFPLTASQGGFETLTMLLGPAPSAAQDALHGGDDIPRCSKEHQPKKGYRLSCFMPGVGCQGSTPHHQDISSNSPPSSSLTRGGHICPHGPKTTWGQGAAPSGATGAYFPRRRHSCERREAAKVQEKKNHTTLINIILRWILRLQMCKVADSAALRKETQSQQRRQERACVHGPA